MLAEAGCFILQWRGLSIIPTFLLFVRFASFVRGEQLRGMTWDDACCPDQRFSTQLSCISPKQPTAENGDVKYMNT